MLWWGQFAEHCVDFGGGLGLGDPAFGEMIVILNVPSGSRKLYGKRINPWCLVQ